MKRFIEGEDRGQITLFPERLEDYVAEDNPLQIFVIAAATVAAVIAMYIDYGGFLHGDNGEVILSNDIIAAHQVKFVLVFVKAA